MDNTKLIKTKTMAKKIIEVQVTRYYSKTKTVEVEVDTDLIGEKLTDYLSKDADLDYKYEYALTSVLLVEDDTKYEYNDPMDSSGGTL